MSSNDSTKKTLIVALLLSLVCAIFVSAAAVMLQPVQEVNKTLDRKRNILAAAGMLDPGKSVEEQFAKAGTPAAASCFPWTKKNVVRGNRTNKTNQQ